MKKLLAITSAIAARARSAVNLKIAIVGLLAASIAAASAGSFTTGTTNVVNPNNKAVFEPTGNLITYATFTNDVAQAWTNNSGGVWNLEAPSSWLVNNGETVTLTYGVDQTNSLVLTHVTPSGDSVSQYSGDASGNGDPTSGTKVLGGNGGSATDPRAFVPSKGLLAVGIMSLDRNNASRSAYLEVTYLDNTTAQTTGANADFTFFHGLTANPTNPIVKFTLYNTSAGPNRWDDMAFIIAPPLPPVISVQPASSLNIYEGDVLGLSVVAVGADTYQWEAGAPGSGIFTNVPGATSATLTIPGMTTSADYHVVVANVSGSVTSTVAAVTVNPATYAYGLFNGDFEFPGGGVSSVTSGFDMPGKDVSGWKNAGANQNDSGLDTSAHSGSYSAKVQKGQSGAYQITTNVLHEGNTITMTWWERNAWQGLTAKVSLLSATSQQDAYGSTTALASQTNALGNGNTDFNWYQRTLIYAVGAGDEGKLLGVFFGTTDTGSGGWGDFDDFRITVSEGVPAPEILSSPVSQTVYEGDPVSFTVVATGLGLGYQWQSGAVGSGTYTNISGASNATLSIAYAEVSADYVVVVTNVSGSVTSSPATLTVTAATYVNGMFNGDFELPGTGKISGGFDVAGANNIPGWRNAGTNQNDEGIEDSGRGYGSLWGGYLQGGQSGAYQLTTNVVQQAGEVITVTWRAVNSYGNPGAKVSLLGASALSDAFDSMTNLASRTDQLTGNWWDQGSWVLYTLSYTAVAGDVGKHLGVAFVFTNTATGSWGNFDNFTLAIQPPTAPPVILTQPASHTAWLASTTTFTVLASGANLSYQWQSGAVGSGIYTNIPNGGQISGADTATLTITNVAVENALDYIVIVTNVGGSVTSSPAATLTVITTAPNMGAIASKTVNQYDDTTLFPAYVDGATSYQWMAGAVGSGLYTNLVNGGRFSGVNTATLSITNVQPADGLDYMLVASNVSGSTTSAAPATLTVIPIIYMEKFTTTNTSIADIGWVADAVNGMYQNIDAGVRLLAYSTDYPQAFYTTTTSDTGSTGLPFPIISLATVSNLAFSVDNQSFWHPENIHTYFAVQINGSQWYVSASEITQANGNWVTQSQTIDTNSYAWNELTVSGTGATNSASIPLIGGAASSGLSGNITGAGLVTSATGTAWVAMDTFKITGDGFTAVPPVNTTPTNLVSSFSGGTLTLSWPADHTGWRLITQTNSRSVGFQAPTNFWFTVPGSSATNSVSITTDRTQPTVFFRLVYP